ncbi:MAG: 2-oxo acid dehydrogenase subunit E2 [Proteobacteria bacterium]|nr:2-oxo acid dehydrogenase subunit E2 [Pseudomonadota bacterium]
MASEVEVRVPDIGDVEDVEVIEILVAPGDRVALEDPLLTIESDKASMEIPSPYAGVVETVVVKLGDAVAEGSLLLTLRAEVADTAVSEPAPSPGTEPETRPEASAAPTPLPPPPKPPVPPVVAEPGRTPHASPLVRKMARELGVDLLATTGSGSHGRILSGDVQTTVREAMAGVAGHGPAPLPSAGAGPQPAVDFSAFGETEVQPLSRIQRVSGRNLTRSWQTVPHVTQHDEADVTELESFRKRHAPEAESQGVKLTLLPFVLKACVQALRDYPEFRSSLDPRGESLIVKHYYHLGVAVDTERGLVVPVVREVDQKGLLELAAELAALSEKARARKLSPADMQGGVMSVSSLGGIGGTHFTPIVNAPEVAVLGVSRIETRAVWRDGDGEGDGEGRFEPRRILPLSLSYDHRVIDGAQAVRFTTHLARSLSAMENLLL